MFRRAIPYLVAGVTGKLNLQDLVLIFLTCTHLTGVVSGIYIFKPLVKKDTQAAQ